MTRFARVVDFQRRQEDRLRSEMAKVQTQLDELRWQQQLLEGQRAAAAQGLSWELHEQFLNYSRVCDDQQMATVERERQLQQQRKDLQQRLLGVWRRRRSLEALDQRQVAAERRAQERRDDAEVMDTVGRAWYLHNDTLSTSATAADVDNHHSEMYS